MTEHHKEVPKSWMPSVSIILPTLNAAGTLERAIGSALAQTLEDWELICVDNGSTDETVRKLRTVASHDSRVRVLAEPAPGAGPARNTGLGAARGRFIAFLDADDQFAAENALATLVQHATRSGAKVCGGSMQVQLRDGTAVEDFEDLNRGFRFEKTEKRDYRGYQFDYGFYRFIYERELLTSTGIKFPHYKRFQDPPFFVRSMLAAGSFYALAQTTYVHHAAHRKLNWDADEVSGLLAGLTDNLLLSRQNRLETLHRVTVERLTAEFAHVIQRQLGQGSPAVMRAAARCLSVIDISLLDPARKELLLAHHRQRLRPPHRAAI
jgi:glycosyltransferase involved in cell wall biosynthesis